MNEIDWSNLGFGYHKTDYKYGKLYQWGRKDPISQNNYTLNGTAWEQFSIERTIQNPTLLPFANSNWAYWVTPDNKNLWSSVQKTIYDPCPEGWRIPDRRRHCSRRR